MKAIVLAGGHATRLWPITKDRAKPLLPLGERPIIDYIIEDLEEEVKEVVISTNKKYAEDFREYIEEYGRKKTKVSIEDQDCEEEKPGTIGAIINLINQEEIDEDLVIIGGDNYYSFEVKDFLNFCREKQKPTNVVYDVENLEIASNFGIVNTEDNKIIDFKEKPENPSSTLASTACYFFPREQVNLFNKYEEHFRNKTDIPEGQYLDEPGRLIEWAHKKTEMCAYSFNGYWIDVGTRRGYLEATKHTKNTQLIKGETENSEIGENVYIMKDAKVKNSKLENTIIFPNAEIQESEIKDSIVDKSAKINDKDLEGALIGTHSLIK